MAAESSWSLRGVDPRAREIARSAAKREGITIGEWLNRQLLEDGEETADNDSAASYSDPEALAHLLDRLSRRIEAAEHRSTLAITGIDQSVLGVISRLQSAEELQSEFSQRYNTALNELRQTQTALQNRIAKLEREGDGGGDLEALKSLEEALSKLANQVYDSETDTRSRLDALRNDIERASKRSGDRIDSVSRSLDERLADVERKVDTDLGGFTETVAREVEAAARKLGRDVAAANEKVDKGLEALRDDLQQARGDMATMIADRAEAGREQIESLETAIGDINDRLGSAERVTDRAIKALEESFAALDARVKTTEERLDSFGDVADRDAFAQEVEARFADLSRELADSVSTTRADLAARMAQIAAETDKAGLLKRLDEMGGRVAAAEQRQRGTLERISTEVAKLAGAVEARVRKSESEVQARLADAEASAQAAQTAASEAASSTKLSDEISDLQARIADAEAASAAAVDEVSRRVDAIGEDASRGVNDEALEARIRESEQRTRVMVDEAVAGMSRRLDRSSAASSEELSPIQVALESLRERLESLEAGGASPDSPSSASRLVDLGLKGDAPDADPDSLDFEVELDDDFGSPASEDKSDEAAASKDDLGADDAFDVDFDDDEAEKAASDADSENFETTAYNFTDDELSDDGFGKDDAGSTDFDLVFGEGDKDAANDQDKDDFLRVARGAARGDDNLDAGFGPVEEAQPGKSKKGRSLLAAAGGLAVLAVGAAGYIALRDAAAPGPVGDGSDDPLNGVFGGADVSDGSTGFAVIPPAVITPTESPFGEGAIPADLDAATGGDFSLFAEGGALFAPIEPETPVAAEDMQTLIERAVAYAPDAPAAPPVAPAPEPTPEAGAEPGVESGSGSVTEAAEPAADAAPTAPAASAEALDAPAEQPAYTEPPAAEAAASEAEAPRASAEQTEAAQAAAAAAGAADDGAVAVTAAAAAEAGDPIAQFEHGGALIDAGELAEGVRLMRQAAENGLPAAQYRLGKLYETGRGVEVDLSEARRWTERAANAGHRRAMHNLGIFYAEGRGAPQDFEEAGRWFEEAALFGATDSQYNLAVLYEQGLGVELSLPDAYAWFAIAARTGDEDAAARADAVAERLSPEARERADEAVRRFSARPLDDEVNGVFRNTPWAEGPAEFDVGTSIARAQAALAQLGYDPGPADGLMGQRTRAAIADYQATNGLAPTGEVDAALVEKLEADAAAL